LVYDFAMTAIAIALLLAVAVTPQSEAPVEGRLCIASEGKLTAGTCSETKGTAFDVAASDVARAFLWTSRDGRVAQVGLLPPKSTRIELQSKERRELTLAIEGAPSRGWPMDTTLKLRGPQEWTWTIPANEVVRFERLAVTEAVGGLEVRAEHHRPAYARIPPGATELGTLTLAPMPRVNGMVVDAQDRAIGGASIALEDGTPCATANEQGAFVCELAEETRAVVVTRPGYGARDVGLPPGVPEPELDLGKVRLLRGATLTLHVDRPEPREPVTVKLLSDVPDRHERIEVREAKLAAGAGEVRLEDVAPGKYIAVLAGDEPLERLEVPLDLEDDRAWERSVTIEPFRLLATVRFGEEPLAEGVIDVSGPQRGWREDVPVRNGRFDAVLWQRGELVGILSSEETGTPELMRSPELGADPSRWDIQLRRRQITGRIFDAESREPIPDIDLRVVGVFEQGRGYFPASVAPDGTYKVFANQQGTYTVSVQEPQYMPFEAEVRLGADDGSRVLDIALQRGVAQALDIVTASGAPIGGARVLEGVLEDRVNPRLIMSADASGRFVYRGAPGTSHLLYVVPRDGSFAVVRVTLPLQGEGEVRQVVVPPPSGSLRVKTVNPEGDPVPAALLLRYNGEFVPAAILRFSLGAMPGTYPGGEGVLGRLPAGTYELWPLLGREDEEAILASGGASRRSATVGLSGGEQSVLMTVPAAK
jgi:hypothetical protein